MRDAVLGSWLVEIPPDTSTYFILSSQHLAVAPLSYEEGNERNAGVTSKFHESRLHERDATKPSALDRIRMLCVLTKGAAPPHAAVDLSRCHWDTDGVTRGNIHVAAEYPVVQRVRTGEKCT